MTFKKTFWKLLSEKTIEIPHYQRDYVQGWTETYSHKAVDKYEEYKIKDLRCRFVKKLFDSIKEEKPLSLNLVFGSENGSKKYFVPVDGQQRLTTLFLVHWYIALRSEELFTHKAIFSHFIYQTRKTSSEFFILLNTINDSRCINVVKALRNNNHYFLHHQADPTVLSALVMIEEIENIFVNIDFKKAFKYLIGEQCLLVFDVIDLGYYNLPDELYIKMNGRGKPLTYFEKFKAWLPDYINDVNRKADERSIIVLPDNWSISLDTKWLDLFWKYKDDSDYIVDQEYMRFFNGMIQLLISADKSYTIDDELKTKVRLFNNPKESQEKNRELELSLEQYEMLECFSESNIMEISKVLDILCLKDVVLSAWLKNLTFITSGGVNNRNTILVDFISGEITYADRLRFFAMYKYLLLKGDNLNEIDFKRWLRILSNLIVNSLLSEENYIKIVRKIDEITAQIIDKEILSFLISHPNLDLLPFDSFQTNEEIRKAKIIIDNPEWEIEIIMAESHPYFKGQIFFLLEMANNDLSKFIEYRDKAIKTFCDNGLVEDKNFFVHRALLSKGDYLFDLTSERKGFCKNNSEWRDKVFKDFSISQNRPNGRIGLLKELLDEISKDNIYGDLKRIVDNFNYPDWRLCFIKNPSSLEVCGEKIINFSSENEIYLLSKSQMNSTHRELRSWCFFKEFLEQGNNNYDPFKRRPWYFGSSNYDKPCAVLDGFCHQGENFKIDIHFSKEGNYIISLFIHEAKGNDIELLSNLNEFANLNMILGTNNRFFCLCKNTQAAHDQLIQICGKLRQLNTDEKKVLEEK